MSFSSTIKEETARHIGAANLLHRLVIDGAGVVSEAAAFEHRLAVNWGHVHPRAIHSKLVGICHC